MNTSENDQNEPQQPPTDPTETQPAPADQDIAAKTHEPQDDLPEWEPLTPELAEEEARARVHDVVRNCGREWVTMIVVGRKAKIRTMPRKGLSV